MAKTYGEAIAACGFGRTSPIGEPRTVAVRPNGVTLRVEEIRWPAAGRTSIRLSAGTERLNLTQGEALRLAAVLYAVGARE